MKAMLKRFTRKFLGTALLMTFLLTQTGCLASGFIGALGATWLNVGAGVTVVGIGTGFWLDESHPTSKINGEVLMYVSGVIGFALDEKNPGRNEALNPLPITQQTAMALHTDLAGLENYNYELVQINSANTILEAHLRKVADDKLSESGLQQAALDLGLSGAQELKAVLRQDKLSSADLEKFSNKNGLSHESARLFMKLRFGIDTAI
jgi:hypothetical protein